MKYHEKFIEFTEGLKDSRKFRFKGLDGQSDTYDSNGDEQFPTKFHKEGFTLDFTVEKSNALCVRAKIGSSKPGDLSNARFKVFESLENLLWVGYQDGQNNDPCSFTYDLDTQHLGDDYWIFTVLCTDYFS